MNTGGQADPQNALQNAGIHPQQLRLQMNVLRGPAQLPVKQQGADRVGDHRGDGDAVYRHVQDGHEKIFYDLFHLTTYTKSAINTVNQCATTRNIIVSTEYNGSLKTSISAMGNKITITAPITIIPFSNIQV